ncbi:BLUF domain-containing protein [Coraliomargarita sp. SDUM461004]|uniref:BLUF domain-containing protein n=1 Tax=Thalassobacterium sedimentorum TaxID=3041258 RepID=A0ABU1AJ79_9BACT|nr:BLUF domain-containing protein [Coraliomargarita sp. SDUM461004]MDQ8194876.1 BLUF domain-containing protein [Coraliomargarita sp. SDUM461004]
MSGHLHQIIYISTAEPELTEDALLELLHASEKRNAERGITGLLLHSDGNIIQIIEGPEVATKELYKKICADTRHRGVTLIASTIIEQRDFPQYRMGFKRIKLKNRKKISPNFSPIVEESRLLQQEMKSMSKLVAVFLETFARTTHIYRPGQK